ncbi:MAG: hypothetical protein GY811_18530 [Myxococcales bacterium]|nr:hypothetical protein [Myxococcales bacterium]
MFASSYEPADEQDMAGGFYTNLALALNHPDKVTRLKLEGQSLSEGDVPSLVNFR